MPNAFARLAITPLTKPMAASFRKSHGLENAFMDQPHLDGMLRLLARVLHWIWSSWTFECLRHVTCSVFSWCSVTGCGSLQHDVGFALGFL